MSIQRELIKLHLEYVNNYLTIEKFAEDYDLLVDIARPILKAAAELHEENVEHFKMYGKLRWEIME